MTMQKLIQAEHEIAQYRADIIKRLLTYAATDMLLFWGSTDELVKRQEIEWTPILEWAKNKFGAGFKPTRGLEVQAENQKSSEKLQSFMQKLSDKQLAAFYLAALNMRSVLLAAALVCGEIDAEKAYKAAYLEELFQADKWGVDAEAEARRQERRQELADIEKFLHS